MRDAATKTYVRSINAKHQALRVSYIAHRNKQFQLTYGVFA
jgi:hypothetical protein